MTSAPYQARRSLRARTCYGAITNELRDFSEALNHGESKKKCANRCLITFMCLLPVLVSILLAEIISVNVTGFKKVSSDNHLLIPLNTSFKIPIDSDRYDAIKFTSLDSYDYNKVKFVTRAYENGTARSDFSKEGNCNVTINNVMSGTCILSLLRYWPLDKENYYGTISCSPIDGNPYFGWEWFDHRTPFDELMKNFHCPAPGIKHRNTYICSDETDPLSVNDIFETYGPSNGRYLLAIRFCPGSENGEDDNFDAVSYQINLQESWPALVYRDYDVYTLFGPQEFKYKATIPLHGSIDSAVYITYESVLSPLKTSLSIADEPQYVTIDYELLQGAYTIEAFVKEQINSAFMVVSIILICTVIVFILCYVRKYY